MLRHLPQERMAALPGEAVAGVRDGLREIRDFVRNHRHDRAGGPRLPGFGLAVSMIDDTLTVTESAARSALPLHLREDTGLRGFRYYLASESLAQVIAERDFRRHMYAAAKRSAAFFGLEGVHVRERVFTSALGAVRRQHHMAADGESSEALDRTSSLAAALFLKLLAADGSAGSSRDRQVKLYAPAVLTIALVSLNPHVAREIDLMEHALFAVEARCERIGAAIDAEDPARELKAVFQALVSHLP